MSFVTRDIASCRNLEHCWNSQEMVEENRSVVTLPGKLGSCDFVPLCPERNCSVQPNLESYNSLTSVFAQAASS